MTRSVRIACSMCVAMVACGCGSSQRLLPLSASDKAIVRGTHLPWTVEVQQNISSVESNNLFEDLNETHLFKSVVLSQSVADKAKSSADFIARIEVEYRSGYPNVYPNPIPVFFILSCGIIPSIIPDVYGQCFSLSSPALPSRKIIVDTRVVGYTVMGFVAIPLKVLPGWSVLISPDKECRYYDHLALAIIKHKDELEALVEAKRDQTGH